VTPAFHTPLARPLRASARYDLVLYDRLPEAERRALAEMARSPGFYGILRPREGSGLGLKAVDRDTALLFLTLREPGPLPSYAHAVLGESAQRTVARLVADGVLEIEDGGAFVSGPSALGLFQAASAGEARGRLAALSVEALRHAEGLGALGLDDPVRLSWSLYTFNRRPLTPRWARLLTGPEAVQSWLGIAPGGPHRALLETWARPITVDGWLSWASFRGRSEPVALPVGGSSGATYKLYISPQPEVLAEGFGGILAALAAARAPQFKIGWDAWGVLRPDKIVAYFPSFERLAEAARATEEHLAGAPAQGVPFTSEIGGDGLLSWGMDPPEEDGSVWSGRESWRLWLARRLASALVTAQAAAQAAAGPSGEAWRFALDRLRLEGVDTDTWTPGALVFRQE
jgi:hypothetical protein